MNADLAEYRSRLQRWLHSPYAALALLTLICHGVLLLCDYKIWDGWLIDDWQQANAYSLMWRQYSEAGILHHFPIHRAFGAFETRVFLYKVVSSVAYWAIACGFYHLARSSGLLGRQCALLAAALMVTCPGLMTLGEAALLPYLLGEAAWFGAACLAIAAESRAGAPHVALRAAAIVLFFFGLTYYAMVVYYLAFYLLLIWFVARQHDVASWRELVPLVFKRVDYLVLPVVFWVVRGRLMPTHGFYANYNSPQLNLENLAEAYGSLFSQYLADHFGEMQSNPILVLAVIAAGVVLARRWPFWQPESWRSLAIMGAVGVFLVVLGCFPYAAVKRTFEASGYASNASQLIPIGGAFLLTGLVGALRLGFPRDRHGALATVVLLYLLVSFAGIWSSNYLHWQALAAKERSVFGKLARDPVAQGISIFYLVDSAPIARTDTYTPAVTTTQVQQAFGDRTRFAMSTKFYPDLKYPAISLPSGLMITIRETSIPYCFESVQVAGRQAYVTIQRGRARLEPMEIAWRDLRFKFSGTRGTVEYEAFLDSLAEVVVLPTR